MNLFELFLYNMKVQKFILSQIVKINSSKNSKNVRVELKFLFFMFAHKHLQQALISAYFYKRLQAPVKYRHPSFIRKNILKKT